MKHLFLPYPLAILAKEKGFTTECWFAWKFIDGSSKENHYEYRMYLAEVHIGIPLYQQIIDWFLNTHNLHIYYSIEGNRTLTGYIGNVDGYSKRHKILLDLYFNEEKLKGYSNKQDALNRAIEEAFKLIK